jgi:hypothetical protein
LLVRPQLNGDTLGGRGEQAMLRFDVRPGLTEEQREALAWGNNAISGMCGLRVPRVAASQSKGMASWALRSYAQLWLHRSTELALGVCAEWNASRLLNAAVILRSLVETLAAFRAPSCQRDVRQLPLEI